MLQEIESKQWGWVVFLASSTTLICCTLPILFVSLGLGAASAALFSNFPLLTLLAQNKFWMFLLSATMIVLAAWVLFRAGRTCPEDAVLAEKCARADRWNKRLLIGSGAIWFIGFIGAYLALPIYQLLWE